MSGHLPTFLWKGLWSWYQSFRLLTLMFCASIVVTKLRQNSCLSGKLPGLGLLSLASFLHNFFLQLSLLCLSVKMCICVIRQGSHSWSVVFRSRGQFFLILMSNGHAQLPPNAHTTIIYVITEPMYRLLYLQHHLVRYVEMGVILKDWSTDRVKWLRAWPWLRQFLNLWKPWFLSSIKQGWR